MQTKNILPLFWEHIEQKKKTSKQAEKIYNWLNEDNLNAICLDGDIFWNELLSSSKMPNYIYTYIKKWGQKMGYTYLYDIKTNI